MADLSHTKTEHYLSLKTTKLLYIKWPISAIKTHKNVIKNYLTAEKSRHDTVL